MKVNTKNIGGEITKENDTYVLEDNNLLEHMTLSKTTLKPNQSTRGHLHDDLEEVYFFTKGDNNIIIRFPSNSGICSTFPISSRS